MSSGFLGIGVTGMQAAQLGLMTTEHNITNANTPGYNRQRIVQAANVATSSGAGFVGQGVRVTTVERMFSDVLNSQVVSSQASVSALDSFSSQISQIDNMLADTDSGVSPALQDFFKGVQQVAADPASLPARQAMVSSAQALTARFNAIDSRLSELQDGVNSQIVSSIGTINTYGQQIAKLNESIVAAQSSTGQPANDLLDQRDQLVADLNKLVGVKTSKQSDGSFNVFIGTGQQLVVGTTAMTMAATPSSADASRLVVGFQTAGAIQELPESLITGGSLGGLIRFRNESLDPTTNELGRVAASMVQTVNAQHALGQDLLGNVGANVKDFFVENPSPLTSKVTANTGNTGGAVVSAALNAPSSNGTNFYTNLTASDYRLAFDGTNYTVTRLSDQKVLASTATAPNTAASAINLPTEGIAIQLTSGAMNANDSFLIQPTREMSKNLSVNSAIVSDPRLIAAAAPVRTAVGATNTGTATITSGSVASGYTTPVASTTLTYNGAPANTLSGFPAAAAVTTVNSAGTVTNYPAPVASIPYNSGDTISFSGVSFQISGVPKDTDRFTAGPNTNGVSDARNALLLGKLQTQNTVSGATATYESSYAQMVSGVGNKTREIQVTQTAQQSLLEQVTASQQAFSGVNLDEEAANLIRYQQAYQAAAKIFSIGEKLFDTLIAL